jgi:type III secretion system HrpB2-like protein
MPDPINAVVSVSQVLNAAKNTPQSSPAMDQLTTKFEAMVNKNAHAPGAPGTPHADPASMTSAQAPTGPNAVSKVLETQEAMLKRTMDEVDNFSANSKRMGFSELVGKGMQMNRNIAMAHVHLNVGLGVAQSSNKGLQGLLKNS